MQKADTEQGTCITARALLFCLFKRGCLRRRQRRCADLMPAFAFRPLPLPNGGRRGASGAASRLGRDPLPGRAGAPGQPRGPVRGLRPCPRAAAPRGRPLPVSRELELHPHACAHAPGGGGLAAVFALEFGIDPGIACELQVKARAVIAARAAHVIGEPDAVDRDFLVAHELVVDTGLEVGLEVAVVVQLPLFAHHQTGAAGKGAGIVLIHVHAVAGGEIHALYPVPGKLQLRLDEQAVIKTEHASHFLADAPA